MAETLIYNPRTKAMSWCSPGQLKQNIMSGLQPVINSEQIAREIAHYKLSLSDYEWEVEEIETTTTGKDYAGNDCDIAYSAVMVNGYKTADDDIDEDADLNYDKRNREALEILVDDRSLPKLSNLGINTLTDFMAADDTVLIKAPWITKKSLPGYRKRCSILFGQLNMNEPFDKE